MKRRLWFMIFGAVVSAGQGYAGSSPADPEDPAQVERGGMLYGQSCSTCHGSRLQGQPDWQSRNPDGTYPAPPHNTDGHTWHHSDRLLFRYVKLGGQEILKDVPGFRSAMPGFSDRMSDQDIWDVLAFIKSHWEQRARAYQEAVSQNDN